MQEKLEKLSVADSLRSIRFAETVVIVFDATIPFEKQDLQLVDLVIREGRAAVLAFNKWDLVEDRRLFLPICAKRPSVCCRRRAVSAPCRSPARPATGSTV